MSRYDVSHIPPDLRYAALINELLAEEVASAWQRLHRSELVIQAMSHSELVAVIHELIRLLNTRTKEPNEA